MGDLKVISELRRQMRGVFADRRWVVGSPVLVSSANIAQTLVGLGAEKVMAIGCNRGTGTLAEDDNIELVDLGIQDHKPDSPGLRESDVHLAHLPQDIQNRVNAFDPHGKARAIGAIFSDGSPIGNREAFGARPETWRALEDKTVIDAFWDAAGVARAPFRIVDADSELLPKAAQDLDKGHGTVWVGDNRDGWHGGAHLLRWVRNAREASQARLFLSEHSDTVRIMPFLEGIPCSIHGWVLPTQTIALRPCEMLVLRIPGSSRLSYAGAATSWQPAEPIYSQMRQTATLVGEHLRATVGYRGSFTVDGIATRDGFLPTELNPRFGGALSRMARRLTEVPLYLLHLISAEGIDFEYHPLELQDLIIETAQSNPVVRALQTLPGLFDIEPRSEDVSLNDDGTWRLRPEGAPRGGTLSIGPSAAGSILFFDAEPDALAVGPSAAPYVCSVFALADELWGLGIGLRTPAPEMFP